MKEKINDLKEYKQSVINTFNRNQEDFEKQIVFISSGTLGLSMFFIEKVVKDLNLSIYKPLLIISWVLLGSTLIINLVSHFISSKYNYQLIDNLNNENLDEEKIKKQQRNLFFINQTSIFTLIFGILFLISYSTLNIMSKSTNNKPANPKKAAPVALPTTKQGQAQKNIQKNAQVALPPVKPPATKKS